MDAYEPRRRKFEQQTHSGTSSAGSMGAGGTGGSSQSGIRDAAAPGNSQSAGPVSYTHLTLPTKA